ncbi:MAG: hypothetical protein AAFP22_16080, partial [Planctomycetota bacterium]
MSIVADAWTCACAAAIVLSVEMAAASFELARADASRGTATADTTAMIATVIISSTSVNPDRVGTAFIPLIS